MSTDERQVRFTDDLLPTPGVQDIRERDVLQAPGQPSAVSMPGAVATPKDGESGVPIESDDQVVNGRASASQEAVKNAHISTDENFAADAALAKVEFNAEHRAVAAFVENLPEPRIHGGRLYIAVDAANGFITSKDVERDDTNDYGSKRFESEIDVAMQPMQLALVGSTTTEVDNTPEAAFVAAAVSQAYSGRAASGVTAPNMHTYVQEAAFRARINRETGRQHRAALVPLITTIIGWLLHIGDLDAKRSHAGWVGHVTDFALAGVKLEGGLSSMDKQCVTAAIMAGEPGTGMGLHADYAGRLVARTTFVGTALRHDPAAVLLEAECNGRYLLAVPRHSQALTAAAVALTAGLPDMERAIGHGKMMCAMSAAGVGFLTGVEGTQVKPDMATAFGRSELVTLLGFVMRSMTEGDQQAQDVALRQVASMMRQSLDSAHDYTDYMRVGIPRISRAYNEAAIRCIWDSTMFSNDFVAGGDDEAVGDRALRVFGEYAVTHVIGMASALFANPMMNPCTVEAGDTSMLQSDQYASMFRMCFEVVGGSLSMAQCMSRVTTRSAVPMTCVAAYGLGVDGLGFTPHNAPYPAMLLCKMDGVMYQLPGGARLTLHHVESATDRPGAIVEALNAPIGTVATALGGDRLVTATQICGGVVDGACKVLTDGVPVALLPVANLAEGNERALWNCLIRHALVSTATVVTCGSQISYRTVVQYLTSHGTRQTAIRTALGVRMTGTTADAAQCNWNWADGTYTVSGRDMRQLDTIDDPFGSAELVISSLRESCNDEALYKELLAMIDQLRYELILLDCADDDDMPPMPFGAYTAAAIGIVPQSVAMAMAIYGQCSFKSSGTLLIERKHHGMITVKSAHDCVAPAVKTAVLATSVGGMTSALHVNNLGGLAATVGQSIVGTATFPINLVSWVIRGVSIGKGTDHETGIRNMTAVTGTLTVKARSTPVMDAGVGTPLFMRNKSVVHVSATNRKARLMKALGTTATGSRAKTFVGPIAIDYMASTLVTAAGVVKQRDDSELVKYLRELTRARDGGADEKKSLQDTITTQNGGGGNSSRGFSEQGVHVSRRQ